jgi:hypothetical protein
MAKNDHVVAMLMKTGLNNVLLPTLFTVVNNIEQYCYTRARLNNIVPDIVDNINRLCTTIITRVLKRFVYR